MSEPAVRAELEITFKDGATSGMKATTDAAEKAAKKVAEVSATAAKKAASETEASTSRQRSSYEKLSRAREVLGVRSERSIQREIQQTEAAYKRLESSGTTSQETLARAADKTRERITRLTNEMGKLTLEQQKAANEAGRLEQVQSRIRTGGMVVAGGAAAAYTLAAPARAAMSFDERIGLRANTAYAEYGPDGRKGGEVQLRQAVKDAVLNGITKDAAMDALDKLIADNQVGGAAGAIKLLPFVAKVATGTGATGVDVAAMMGNMIGSGYAKDADQAKRLVGMSLGASKAGAFEMPDMARYLPSLLPLAKSAGLTGEDGFRRLLVLLQQARTTAGTSEAAARNVENLLSKLQSNDTAIDFKKAGRGDLSKHLMDQRAKGVDPLTAWQNVIDDEVARNPNLAPAMARLKNAKSKDEMDAAIESIKGMAEGQSIGKYFQDMQARGGVMGLRNVEFGKKVDDAISRSGNAVEEDYAYMADKAGVETRVASESVDMSRMDAMDKLTPAIGAVSKAFTDLAIKYPLLTGAGTLATGALVAVAGAAGLASVAMGGGKTEAIARAATKYGPKAAKVGRGGLLGVGALAGGYALDAGFGEESAISRYGSSALNGAAMGGMLGSFVPVLGTAIGAGVGGGLGLLYEALKPVAQKPVDVNASMTVGLAPGLVLQNQSMKTSGSGDVQMDVGGLWGVP